MGSLAPRNPLAHALCMYASAAAWLRHLILLVPPMTQRSLGRLSLGGRLLTGLLRDGRSRFISNHLSQVRLSTSGIHGVRLKEFVKLVPLDVHADVKQGHLRVVMVEHDCDLQECPVVP